MVVVVPCGARGTGCIVPAMVTVRGIVRGHKKLVLILEVASWQFLTITSDHEIPPVCTNDAAYTPVAKVWTLRMERSVISIHDNHTEL